GAGRGSRLARVFAVHAGRSAAGLRVVPEETAGGVGHRVAAVVGVAAALVAGPEAVLGLVGLREPLVPIRAVAAGGVEIVQQDELFGHAVLVRRHLFAEHDERRVGVAFGDIAEHLVVRPVFLHYEDDVLDRGGFAGTAGDGYSAGVARCFALLFRSRA